MNEGEFDHSGSIPCAADAAFAKPEVYEALEERGVKVAIRIPSDDSRERDIPGLLRRPGDRSRIRRRERQVRMRAHYRPGEN